VWHAFESSRLQDRALAVDLDPQVKVLLQTFRPCPLVVGVALHLVFNEVRDELLASFLVEFSEARVVRARHPAHDIAQGDRQV
jgi:hypothetical protein